MRIDRLETVAYSLPFREPYVTARGTLERRELLLVRLRTAGGPAGVGVAAPLALRGGAPAAALEAELRVLCAPAIEGRKARMKPTARTSAAMMANSAGPLVFDSQSMMRLNE